MNYNFNVGTYLDITTIPAFSTTDFSQLATSEIRIFVDTSIQRTVALPSALQFNYQNAVITIIDSTNTASRNPIIITGYNIGGNAGSATINQDNGFMRFGINSYNTGWLILDQPNIIQTLIRAFDPPAIQNLFTNRKQLLLPPPSGYFYDILSVFGEAIIGTAPYDGKTGLGIYYDGAASWLFRQGSGAPSNGCILNQPSPYSAKFEQRNTAGGTDNFFLPDAAIYLGAIDENPFQAAGDEGLVIYLTYTIRQRITSL